MALAESLCKHPKCPSIISSHRSKSSRFKLKTKKSWKSHPYASRKLLSVDPGPLTTDRFFEAISLRRELGKDFLREMDTPICTFKTIFLPLEIGKIAPGKCLILSPFGHTSNLGFHCDQCSKDQQPSVSLPHGSNFKSTSREPQDDTFSVTLTFYNHADKVVQHKTFYLSLLCLSMSTVQMSFYQPGLFYAYFVVKSLYKDILPVFTMNQKKSLTMYILFKESHLHIGENCLRLLTDNLTSYLITLDCVKQTYMLKLSPVQPEEKIVNVRENQICEAISALDCTDELREEIARGLALIM